MEHSWFLIALLAPFLWAVVTVLDNYFVHAVYRDEYDGTVVSGIFQLVPWLLVVFHPSSFLIQSPLVTFLAILAGSFFITSFFWYFRGLFTVNDAVLMQIIWNLSVVVVPFFAWLFFREILVWQHYLGIVVSLCGIMLFYLDANLRAVGMRKIFRPMFLAVMLFSLHMVLMKKAYSLAAPDDFLSIFLLFSLGAAATSILIVLIGCRGMAWKNLKRIIRLSRKHFGFFMLGEGLSLAGTVASQLALSLAPSAVAVAIVEALVPLFIMVISFGAVWFMRGMVKSFNTKLFLQQLAGARIKFFAMGFVVAGVALVM